MMYSEFLDLTSTSEKDVSYKEYNRYIEPVYMNDETCENKRQWCKKFAPGIIAMIPKIRLLEEGRAIYANMLKGV